MAFCSHGSEHNVQVGQSPGNVATDDSTSNHQPSRFVPHFRWNTQEDDSFLGCQEGVLQCGFEPGNLCSPGDRPMQGWTLLVAEKSTVRDSYGIPNVG